MSPARSFPAVLGALAWAAACGAPADRGVDAGVVVLDAHSFEAFHAEALCEAKVRCQELPSPEACTPLTLGPSRATTFGTDAALFASIREGRLPFSKGAAQACLEALRTQPCTVLGAVLSAAEACRDLFVGDLPAGEFCLADAVCGPGLRCEGDGCEGRCEPVGDGRCRRQVDCTEGRACENGRCVEERAPGAHGDRCGAPRACLEGLQCLREGDLLLCREAPGEGEPCDVRQACASVDLVCFPREEGPRCGRRVRAGQPCRASFDCAGGAVCAAELSKCVAPPAEGPCLVADLGPVCDPARAWCDAGTCRPLVAEDEACRDDDACAEPSRLRCVAGRCATPPDPQACQP